MAPATKPSRPRSTLLIALGVVALVLTLIFASALLYFFVFNDGSKQPAPNSTSLPLFLQPSALPSENGTDSSGAPIVVEVASTMSGEDLTTTVTSTATPIAEPSEYITTTQASESVGSSEAIPTLSLPKEDEQLILTCAAIVPEPTPRARSQEDFRVIGADVISPLEYKLNISIPSTNIDQISGSLSLFVRANTVEKQISLNAGQNLKQIDEVSVINCRTGKTLRIANVEHDISKEMFSILLDEKFDSGDILRLHFPRFIAANVRKDGVIFQTEVQRRGPFLRMVSSKGAPTRKLIPSFDDPKQKAPLTLCINHWKDALVRANTEASMKTGETSCFETTKPLAPKDYSFLVYEYRGLYSANYNGSTENDIAIPIVDIFVSTLRKTRPQTNEYKWIYENTKNAMSTFSDWFSFPFPAKKLFIYMVPPTYYAGSTEIRSSLGMISLEESEVENKMKIQAHKLLVRSVASQWIGGIVSTDECFQKALSTYLEWKVHEKLNQFNISRQEEINKLRDERWRMDPQTSDACTESFPAIFYSLDITNDDSAIQNMIKKVLAEKAFKYISINDWANALIEVTGNQHSGQFLIEWFERREWPVLKVSVDGQSLTIKQNGSTPWTLGLPVATSRGSYPVVLNRTELRLPIAGDVVVDPLRRIPAIILYNAEGYLGLKRCWSETTCPAPKWVLRGFFADLVTELERGNLEAPAKPELAKWREVLGFILEHQLLPEDKMCCVYTALRKAPSSMCYWSEESCRAHAFVSQLLSE